MFGAYGFLLGTLLLLGQGGAANVAVAGSSATSAAAPSAPAAIVRAGIPADATDPGIPAAIDSLLAAYHRAGQLNGVALVAQGGRVLLHKGYGKADFEWDLPVTPDTRFRIGSITKTFTAALVLQLIEEGRLTLDTKLADILPAYRKDTGSRITVRHLLHHTSGLPGYAGLPGVVEAAREGGVDEFVARFCSGDLEFEPGARFHYSNTGYYVLGAVIEKVTGKPYDVVLRERILEPCAMHSSGLDRLARLLPKRAAGYVKTAAGLTNVPAYDAPLFYAAGGMYSTAEDLLRWDEALAGDALLNRASRDSMFAVGPGGYGCGWYVKRVPVGPGDAMRTSLSHGGAVPGFNGLIRRIPEDRVVVILLNNTGGTRLEAVSNGILDLVYGRPAPPPRTPLDELLMKTLDEQGIAAAEALFRDLKARDYDSYDFEEPRLIELGYRLLGAGCAEEAVAILALTAETYPESWNAHDSLGEVQLAAGRKAEALESYRRSLELNPKNARAARQIEKLSGGE